MRDLLKSLFGGAAAKDTAADAREVAVSIAALMVEAARADEVYAEKEQALISRLLASEFSVAPADAPGVFADAEKRQAEAVDLYQFVRQVKSLPQSERIRIIEAMWRVVLCDDERQDWEDMLIRRVCGLIYVEDVDSGLARQRAAKALGR